MGGREKVGRSVTKKDNLNIKSWTKCKKVKIILKLMKYFGNSMCGLIYFWYRDCRVCVEKEKRVGVGEMA